MKFSILIPVYNERTSVKIIIEKVLKLEHIHEIIVVDDCSTDGTREYLKTLSQDRLKVDFHAVNRGKTAAINTAIGSVTGDYIIIQDADLEYDPEELPSVIEPILNGHADVVYGSRFLVRKTSRVLYFYHYLANKFLTLLSNIFTNLNMTDIETCYKVFPSQLIKNLLFTSKGFGMEVEITALIGKSRYRTYEVPISYYGRTYEEGKKIQTKDGIQAIFDIFYFNLIYVRKKAVRNHLRQLKNTSSSYS